MDWVSVQKLVLELGCSACVDLTGVFGVSHPAVVSVPSIAEKLVRQTPPYTDIPSHYRPAWLSE